MQPVVNVFSQKLQENSKLSHFGIHMKVLIVTVSGTCHTQLDR